MLKRFGLPTLALATAMAVAAPTVTLARDRDDHRGGDAGRHEVVRRDFHGDHDRDFRGGRGINFGLGFYSAPAPVVAPAPAPATGYYDQYGVWHPYGYYDQFGVWRAY